VKTRKVKLKKRSQTEKPVTRKGVIIFVSLLVLAVVGFIFGVRMGVARKDSNLVNSSDLTNKGLYYQLKMEKTEYDIGEPISVQLSVTNVTSNPIVLDFQKNLEFDLTVRKEVDLLFAQVPKTVWRLSEKQMVYKDKHVLRVDAGKTLTFKGTWDQTNRAEEPVKPGRYQIIGNLLADNREESLQIKGQTNQ
jgi:intracellular proteinase inhibitor BsuPI